MATRLASSWMGGALLALLSCGVAGAQDRASDRKLDKRPNDPTTCPYCRGDPKLLEAAGLVSHGGFEFGIAHTAQVDGLLASSDIRWIESKHFEIGFALGPQKVKEEEKKKIRAELARLQQALPEVDPKAKILDPWLRAHLYAQRAEEVWTRFQELMQVKDSDFPSGSTPWNRRGKYMGSGPYMGQKGKFEVLILPSESAATTFLKGHFGLLTRMTQRWNVIERDTLILVVHIGQSDSLREDQALHGHVAFNLAINLLDGYKHYSYDTPIWLREGLGHFVEREISPKFNSFDSSEGAVADVTRKEKWEPEVRKLIAAGEAVRMAELTAMKDYSELKLPHHYTTWSMIDYLVKTNPAGLACLNDRIHGIVNEQGIPDGGRLMDTHRAAFQECLGMNYAEFDAAWSKWVMETYAAM